MRHFFKAGLPFPDANFLCLPFFCFGKICIHLYFVGDTISKKEKSLFLDAFKAVSRTGLPDPEEHRLKEGGPAVQGRHERRSRIVIDEQGNVLYFGLGDSPKDFSGE